MDTKNVELVARACSVCGSTDESHVFAEANFDLDRLGAFAFASRKLPEYMYYRLLLCPSCDLLYASPIPRLGALAEAYHEAAFDSSEEAHFAARTYASFLPRIVAKTGSKKGALDIGTGDGAFLEELLSLGYTDVVGVEPSVAPISAARPDVRPLIKQGLFRPQDFSGESFSLVTCFQTLEHLYDPLEMCRSARQMLRPGGAAFFVCHDHRALSAKILGKKSPIFDIEHLQLFSRKSARSLMERCGFSHVEVHPVMNRYPLHYWLKLLPIPSVAKTRLIEVAKSTLGGIPISLPAGNLAVIGYR